MINTCICNLTYEQIIQNLKNKRHFGKNANKKVM
jgi:hypothetical protein